MRDAVRAAEAGIKAGLVRLFFHDCFVQGCDASVLLKPDNDTNPQPEMLGIPNLSLRGFEVIDAAKAALEAECPGVVSCADIVAFAGRDASVFLSGSAINFTMPAGRYDGKVSLASETLPNLPPPFADVARLKAMFAAKGHDTVDITTREPTLERCPNLALASAFFAPGTKGPCPTVVRGARIFSPGWYYQPGLKVTFSPGW